jgi:hypothetical protein
MTKEEIEKAYQRILMSGSNKNWGLGAGVNPYSTDEEWAEWARNWSSWKPNPLAPSEPETPQKMRCEKHEWVDTGTAKTWCKKCDRTGRWEMGIVHVQD